MELDEKRGIMKLVAETEDDLWVLYLSLEKGDEVIAATTRDVSIGGESRRVPMVISIRVEKAEFQQYTNRLRIHGVILDAPERFGVKGQYHTINLDLNREVVIIKEKWPKYIIERIKRQAERARRVLLLLTDYDEYLIAVPMLQGLKILVEAEMRPPNKEQSQVEENLEMVVRDATSFASTYSSEVIVVAGPGNFKDLVAQRLRGKYSVYVEHVHSATRNGLSELLRRDVMKLVMRDYEISEGVKVFERVKDLIGRGSGLVTYGKSQVMEAATLGAVSELLVVEDLLATEDVEGRKSAEKIMEEVESKGGKIWIVPKDSPIYHQVRNLTGVVATLRFQLN
ncbi:mRNA surveillance protein Pelota [Sulfodiicoccus acidiphilus]|uniref:Protein pelota homolog n=1 Tax=Sulfodiicoccus acidiphilus TaxID=1670455 RepID=A0A830H1B9_9CREN|nr:mRNA surveillance protein Pelota [Sulfodiicoccus acidiphilus]